MRKRLLLRAGVITLAATLSLGSLVGCSEEVNGPQPGVSGLTPSLVCGEQLTTAVVIRGERLSPLAIDAAKGSPMLALPQIELQQTQDLGGNSVAGAFIELPNDPANPSAARVRWTSTSSMEFDVYPELGLAPGLYQVRVSNRNGNTVTFANALAVVPRPTLTIVDPDMVCLEQGMRSVILTGEAFISIGSQLPSITIGDVTFTDGITLGGCSDLPGPTAAQFCTTAELVIPEDAIQTGARSVTITNPETASCSSEDAVDMAIVPRPSLTKVEPELFCGEQAAQVLTLTGTDFIALRDAGGDMLPIVTIGSEALVADAATGCAAVGGTLLDAESCSSLTVTVPTSVTLLGEQTVTVTNPDPAGCDSEESISVFLAGAPVITEVQPPVVCEVNQPTLMTVVGTGFLRVDNGAGGFIDPIVEVDSAAVVATYDSADCTAFTSSVVDGEFCTAFSFPVPGGGFGLGTHDVDISNPAPADCTASASFDVATAPIVTDVRPFAVCSDGDTFRVDGSGFVDGSEILLDGTGVPTGFIDVDELEGTIASGFAADVYDVSVTNGEMCESNVLSAAINVVDAPIVFFVDPPNVYDGIDMRITIFVTGIYDADPAVGIRATGTADALTMLGNPAYNGSNRIQADIPAGLVPAGDYDVVVIDDPCSAELANVLHVTDTLSVHISGMDPQFTVEGKRTGVTLRSDDPTPAMFENFEATPRAYLNPVGGGVATEVRAVSFLSAQLVTGIVPKTLPPGSYQLVIVNPDGDVGLLSSPEFRVLPSSDPPPVIDELRPALVEDKPTQQVDIVGENFPTVAGDLSVTADCRDPLGVQPSQLVTATFGALSVTVVESIWDMSGLSGFVCVVRLSNLANATFTDFSAITVTNSSGNLRNFNASLDMREPRRAAGGAAIRMNEQSRFLFAIGGDLGDNTTDPVVRHSSVEVVSIDPFGDLTGQWALQRNSLPEPRAFINAAVVGRHIYLAGGRVGAGDPGTVDNAVLRAYLLDPFEAPEVNDIAVIFNDTAGLDAGIWTYRVAALMGPTDGADAEAPENNNPNGESLPSEPFVLQLPISGVELTLFWGGVDGAVKYLIYRTPVVNGIAGQERFLAEVDHLGAVGDRQEFTDDGTLDNTAETRTPMPLGSLGVWHQIGTLQTEREGAALVAAPDSADPSIHYLYVLGGRDTDGILLDTYEWAAVVNVPGKPNIQTVTTFQRDDTNTLPTARWQGGAVFVDSSRGPVSQGAVWIYALPGIDGGGPTGGLVAAFPVDVADGTGNQDGSLGAPTTVAGTKAGGYGYAAGNNFIHLMGGVNATLSAGGRKAQISGEPTLENWSNGTNLTVKRYLLATARESAFIFLLGGQTETEFASRSTERSNF